MIANHRHRQRDRERERDAVLLIYTISHLRGAETSKVKGNSADDCENLLLKFSEKIYLLALWDLYGENWEKIGKKYFSGVLILLVERLHRPCWSGYRVLTVNAQFSSLQLRTVHIVLKRRPHCAQISTFRTCVLAFECDVNTPLCGSTPGFYTYSERHYF